MMGGSVYRGYGDAGAPPVAEWNILCDPLGAKELLASGVPVFMLPLDSTQIPLDTERREVVFSNGSPLTDQLALLYHQWLAGTDGHPLAPILYDSVVVAYSLRPDLCPMAPMHLEVDDRGFTRPSSGIPNVHVCLTADEKGFLEFDIERLTKREGPERPTAIADLTKVVIGDRESRCYPSWLGLKKHLVYLSAAPSSSQNLVEHATMACCEGMAGDRPGKGFRSTQGSLYWPRR